MREKEEADFQAEAKELESTITNCKNAVAALSKQNGGESFLQMDAPVLSSIQAVLRDASYKYEMRMAAKTEHARGKAGTALLAISSKSGEQTAQGLTKQLMSEFHMGHSQSVPLDMAAQVLDRHVRRQNRGPVVTGFLQADKGPSSYSSQSGGVFGILKTMLEEFERDLASAQADEEKSKADAEAMIAAKNDEIDATLQKKDEMENEHAENQKALSDGKADREMTEKQREADIQFLKNLKQTCESLDEQYAERSKARSEEVVAVSETIKILTDDDAKDLFRKSINFLQETSTAEESSGMRARRRAAVAVLHKAMQAPSFDADDLLAAWHSRPGAAPAKSVSKVSHLQSPRAQLSALAVSAQLDGFKKVKEMMNAMIAEIKKQSADETDFKASCVDRFNKNEKDTYENTENKDDLEVKMHKFKRDIQSLGEDIAAAKELIKETSVGVKKASETREGENAEYQTLLADQRATQEVLKKALDRLALFYKEKGAALLQRGEESLSQTPPAQFKKMKKSSGASPVMALLESIIADSVKVENEAVKNEAAAQKDYEAFVKDSNALIATQTEVVTEKTKAIAAIKMDFTEAEGERESVIEEIDLLKGMVADVHEECDWTLKNFDIRQKARLEEMESISQALSILSGSM